MEGAFFRAGWYQRLVCCSCLKYKALSLAMRLDEECVYSLLFVRRVVNV